MIKERSDAALLADVARWRELLARDVAGRNRGLPSGEVHAFVQELLDRAIFLRMCADRGLESPEHVESSAHNSPTVAVDPQVWANFLAEVAAPDRARAIASVGADLPGRIYEQYLGSTTVRVNGNASARIAKQSAGRKARGVYYTPSYLVDFIVHNTVGQLLADWQSTGATPPVQRGERPISVLDPACGGGSFLLRAYQYLLDWHLHWYEAHAPERNSEQVCRAADGSWRLTQAERWRILLDHIHGVDIDPQAVAITRRALWLKLMEGEPHPSPRYLQANGDAPWRRLAANIKCGDALTSPDAGSGVGGFAWRREFAAVLSAGGFDVVIGNPPYVKEYTNRKAFGDLKHSPLAKYYLGKMDLWYVFACLAIDLLSDDGWHAFIATNNWTTSAGAKALRHKVRSECWLEQVVDFGAAMTFGAVSIQTMVYVARKGSARRDQAVSYTRFTRADASDQEIRAVLEGRTNAPRVTRFQARLPPDISGAPFTFVEAASQSVLDKIAAAGIFRLQPHEIAQGIVPNPDVVSRRALALLDAARSRESRVQTGDPVFVVPCGFFADLSASEARFLKPCYEPADLERYRLPRCHTREMIYLTRDNDPGNLTTLYQHLSQYRAIMEERRENRRGRITFRHLHWPRDERFFDVGPKVLCVRKCRHPVCVYTTQPAYVMMAINVIRTERVDLKLLTGLLNSRVVHFWLDQCGKKQGEHLQIDKEPLIALPLLSVVAEVGQRRDQIQLLSKLVDEMITLAQSQGDQDSSAETQTARERRTSIDRRIDAVVYDLYGLLPADIEVIERITAARSVP